MIWVLIFAGIAVAGLVMVVCYAIWLVHKLGDLYSEVTMLGKRGQELLTLLEGVRLPSEGTGSQ